ncbi:hypothetical protein BsWGS_18659 [Bradybaena similaris]
MDEQQSVSVYSQGKKLRVLKIHCTRHSLWRWNLIGSCNPAKVSFFRRSIIKIFCTDVTRQKFVKIELIQSVVKKCKEMKTCLFKVIAGIIVLKWPGFGFVSVIN